MHYYSPRDDAFRDFLLMDYMPFRSLKQLLVRHDLTMTSRTKLAFLCKVVGALRFLKTENIVHLGIKPSNILIDGSYNVKLGDFSSSHRINHTDISNIRGTNRR